MSIRNVIVCVVIIVVQIHGLVQLRATLASSDNPLLTKILQSIDAATSDEHLFEVTLKLLKSLCACMRDTLKAKEDRYNSDKSLMGLSKSINTEGKVIDLYKKIYNNTCFNLKQVLSKRNNKSNETWNTSNCGKDYDQKSSGTLENEAASQIVKNVLKSKLDHILYRALVQTRHHHKYKIKKYNLFGKAKSKLINSPKHTLIVILTLHPDKKDLRKYNVVEEDLHKILHKNSTIEIDIIDTRYDQKEKESEETPKTTIYSDCHLQSLYTYLTESEKKNLTKVFRFLRRRDTIKVYIEVFTGRNHTDYINICCENGTMIALCKKGLIGSLDSQEDVTVHYKKLDKEKSMLLQDDFKNTISKLKNLVKKLRFKSSSHTTNDLKINVTNNTGQNRLTHNIVKGMSLLKENNSITVQHGLKTNSLPNLEGNLTHPMKLRDVSRAIILLNDFVSKQTNIKNNTKSHETINQTHYTHTDTITTLDFTETPMTEKETINTASSIIIDDNSTIITTGIHSLQNTNTMPKQASHKLNENNTPQIKDITRLLKLSSSLNNNSSISTSLTPHRSAINKNIILGLSSTDMDSEIITRAIATETTLNIININQPKTTTINYLQNMNPSYRPSKLLFTTLSTLNYDIESSSEPQTQHIPEEKVYVLTKTQHKKSNELKYENEKTTIVPQGGETTLKTTHALRNNTTLLIAKMNRTIYPVQNLLKETANSNIPNIQHESKLDNSLTFITKTFTDVNHISQISTNNAENRLNHFQLQNNSKLIPTSISTFQSINDMIKKDSEVVLLLKNQAKRKHTTQMTVEVITQSNSPMPTNQTYLKQTEGLSKVETSDNTIPTLNSSLYKPHLHEENTDISSAQDLVNSSTLNKQKLQDKYETNYSYLLSNQDKQGNNSIVLFTTEKMQSHAAQHFAGAHTTEKATLTEKIIWNLPKTSTELNTIVSQNILPSDTSTFLTLYENTRLFSTQNLSKNLSAYFASKTTIAPLSIFITTKKYKRLDDDSLIQSTTIGNGIFDNNLPYFDEIPSTMSTVYTDNHRMQASSTVNNNRDRETKRQKEIKIENTQDTNNIMLDNSIKSPYTGHGSSLSNPTSETSLEAEYITVTSIPFVMPVVKSLDDPTKFLISSDKINNHRYSSITTKQAPIFYVDTTTDFVNASRMKTLSHSTRKSIQKRAQNTKFTMTTPLYNLKNHLNESFSVKPKEDLSNKITSLGQIMPTKTDKVTDSIHDNKSALRTTKPYDYRETGTDSHMTASSNPKWLSKNLNIIHENNNKISTDEKENIERSVVTPRDINVSNTSFIAFETKSHREVYKNTAYMQKSLQTPIKHTVANTKIAMLNNPHKLYESENIPIGIKSMLTSTTAKSTIFPTGLLTDNNRSNINSITNFMKENEIKETITDRTPLPMKITKLSTNSMKYTSYIISNPHQESEFSYETQSLKPTVSKKVFTNLNINENKTYFTKDDKVNISKIKNIMSNSSFVQKNIVNRKHSSVKDSPLDYKETIFTELYNFDENKSDEHDTSDPRFQESHVFEVTEYLKPTVDDKVLTSLNSNENSVYFTKDLDNNVNVSLIRDVFTNTSSVQKNIVSTQHRSVKDAPSDNKEMIFTELYNFDENKNDVLNTSDPRFQESHIFEVTEFLTPTVDNEVLTSLKSNENSVYFTKDLDNNVNVSKIRDITTNLSSIEKNIVGTQHRSVIDAPLDNKETKFTELYNFNENGSIVLDTLDPHVQESHIYEKTENLKPTVVEKGLTSINSHESNLYFTKNLDNNVNVSKIRALTTRIISTPNSSVKDTPLDNTETIFTELYNFNENKSDVLDTTSENINTFTLTRPSIERSTKYNANDTKPIENASGIQYTTINTTSLLNNYIEVSESTTQYMDTKRPMFEEPQKFVGIENIITHPLYEARNNNMILNVMNTTVNHRNHIEEEHDKATNPFTLGEYIRDDITPNSTVALFGNTKNSIVNTISIPPINTKYPTFDEPQKFAAIENIITHPTYEATYNNMIEIDNIVNHRKHIANIAVIEATEDFETNPFFISKIITNDISSNLTDAKFEKVNTFGNTKNSIINTISKSPIDTKHPTFEGQIENVITHPTYEATDNNMNVKPMNKIINHRNHIANTEMIKKIQAKTAKPFSLREYSTNDVSLNSINAKFKKFSNTNNSIVNTIPKPADDQKYSMMLNFTKQMDHNITVNENITNNIQDKITSSVFPRENLAKTVHGTTYTVPRIKESIPGIAQNFHEIENTTYNFNVLENVVKTQKGSTSIIKTFIHQKHNIAMTDSSSKYAPPNTMKDTMVAALHTLEGTKNITLNTTSKPNNIKNVVNISEKIQDTKTNPTTSQNHITKTSENVVNYTLPNTRNKLTENPIFDSKPEVTISEIFLTDPKFTVNNINIFENIAKTSEKQKTAINVTILSKLPYTKTTTIKETKYFKLIPTLKSTGEIISTHLYNTKNNAYQLADVKNIKHVHKIPPNMTTNTKFLENNTAEIMNGFAKYAVWNTKDAMPEESYPIKKENTKFDTKAKTDPMSSVDRTINSKEVLNKEIEHTASITAYNISTTSDIAPYNSFVNIVYTDLVPPHKQNIDNTKHNIWMSNITVPESTTLIPKNQIAIYEINTTSFNNFSSPEQDQFSNYIPLVQFASKNNVKKLFTESMSTSVPILLARSTLKMNAAVGYKDTLKVTEPLSSSLKSNAKVNLLTANPKDFTQKNKSVSFLTPATMPKDEYNYKKFQKGNTKIYKLLQVTSPKTAYNEHTQALNMLSNFKHKASFKTDTLSGNFTRRILKDYIPTKASHAYVLENKKINTITVPYIARVTVQPYKKSKNKRYHSSTNNILFGKHLNTKSIKQYTAHEKEISKNDKGRHIRNKFFTTYTEIPNTSTTKVFTESTEISNTTLTTRTNFRSNNLSTIESDQFQLNIRVGIETINDRIKFSLVSINQKPENKSQPVVSKLTKTSSTQLTVIPTSINQIKLTNVNTKKGNDNHSDDYLTRMNFTRRFNRKKYLKGTTTLFKDFEQFSSPRATRHKWKQVTITSHPKNKLISEHIAKNLSVVMPTYIDNNLTITKSTIFSKDKEVSHIFKDHITVKPIKRKHKKIVINPANLTEQFSIEPLKMLYQEHLQKLKQKNKTIGKGDITRKNILSIGYTDSIKPSTMNHTEVQYSVNSNYLLSLPQNHLSTFIPQSDQKTEETPVSVKYNEIIHNTTQALSNIETNMNNIKLQNETVINNSSVLFQNQTFEHSKGSEFENYNYEHDLKKNAATSVVVVNKQNQLNNSIMSHAILSTTTKLIPDHIMKNNSTEHTKSRTYFLITTENNKVLNYNESTSSVTFNIMKTENGQQNISSEHSKSNAIKLQNITIFNSSEQTKLSEITNMSVTENSIMTLGVTKALKRKTKKYTKRHKSLATKRKRLLNALRDKPKIANILKKIVKTEKLGVGKLNLIDKKRVLSRLLTKLSRPTMQGNVARSHHKAITIPIFSNTSYTTTENYNTQIAKPTRKSYLRSAPGREIESSPKRNIRQHMYLQPTDITPKKVNSTTNNLNRFLEVNSKNSLLSTLIIGLVRKPNLNISWGMKLNEMNKLANTTKSYRFAHKFKKNVTRLIPASTFEQIGIKDKITKLVTSKAIPTLIKQVHITTNFIKAHIIGTDHNLHFKLNTSTTGQMKPQNNKHYITININIPYLQHRTAVMTKTVINDSNKTSTNTNTGQQLKTIQFAHITNIKTKGSSIDSSFMTKDNLVLNTSLTRPFYDVLPIVLGKKSNIFNISYTLSDIQENSNDLISSNEIKTNTQFPSEHTTFDDKNLKTIPNVIDNNPHLRRHVGINMKHVSPKEIVQKITPNMCQQISGAVNDTLTQVSTPNSIVNNYNNQNNNLLPISNDISRVTTVPIMKNEHYTTDKTVISRHTPNSKITTILNQENNLITPYDHISTTIPTKDLNQLQNSLDTKYNSNIQDKSTSLIKQLNKSPDALKTQMFTRLIYDNISTTTDHNNKLTSLNNISEERNSIIRYKASSMPNSNVLLGTLPYDDNLVTTYRPKLENKSGQLLPKTSNNEINYTTMVNESKETNNTSLVTNTSVNSNISMFNNSLFNEHGPKNSYSEIKTETYSSSRPIIITNASEYHISNLPHKVILVRPKITKLNTKIIRKTLHDKPVSRNITNILDEKKVPFINSENLKPLQILPNMSTNPITMAVDNINIETITSQPFDTVNRGLFSNTQRLLLYTTQKYHNILKEKEGTSSMTTSKLNKYQTHVFKNSNQTIPLNQIPNSFSTIGLKPHSSDIETLKNKSIKQKVITISNITNQGNDLPEKSSFDPLNENTINLPEKPVITTFYEVLTQTSTEKPMHLFITESKSDSNIKYSLPAVLPRLPIVNNTAETDVDSRTQLLIKSVSDHSKVSLKQSNHDSEVSNLPNTATTEVISNNVNKINDYTSRLHVLPLSTLSKNHMISQIYILDTQSSKTIWDRHAKQKKITSGNLSKVNKTHNYSSTTNQLSKLDTKFATVEQSKGKDPNKVSTTMVTDWWLNDMYLKVRLPLPINSNPGMVFPRRHFAKMEEVADLGALFIDDILDYKEMLDRGELPLERATSREKGQPLCMEQFYRLLGVCRIPEVGKDRLEFPSVKAGPEEQEELVVVACRNYFYPIPVKAADRGRLTPGEIQAQLLHAMVDAAGAPPAPRVGLLTAMNRDQWARAREHLIKDETNRTNLELISRALCILCLDEAGGDRADTDPETNAMLRAMHGAGTRYHSANRWFDKTVQLIISSDGTVGMCYEHSAAEGVAVVHLAERALARAEVADRPAPPPALLPAPQAMKWNVTPEVQRNIEQAARDLDRAISDLDFKIYTYRGYGREFMKSCRTSPDVYIQLAIQYAYYKLYGYLVTTYESASLRRFRQGRVDNIRSAHGAALAWAASMCTAETSPLNDGSDEGQKKVSFNLYGEQKKLELFEEAARKQTSIMEANILGKGIDNHLLGLREMARETLGDLPPVFCDDAYKQMFEFKMSTSQVTTTTDGTYMGYGAVCPDGYGCCYNPKKDSIIFCISSFTSSSVTNTEAYRQALEEALDSMKLMFQARKVDN